MNDQDEPVSDLVRRVRVAAAVSAFGDGVFLAAAPLLAATLTSNPLRIALVAAATGAPLLVLKPLAGAIVDHSPRRTVMFSADVLAVYNLLACALIAMIGKASLPVLAATGFCLTCSQILRKTVALAGITRLAGNASTVAGRHLASIAGPLAGGVLFVLAPWAPLVAGAASFAWSACLLRGVPAPPCSPLTDTSVLTLIARAFAGTLRDRRLLGLFVLGAASSFAVNTAMATFVLYARLNLGITAAGYGALLAAQACGMSAGGWIAALSLQHMKPRHLLIASQLLRSGVLFTLAARPSPLLAAVCMAAIGAGITVETISAVAAPQRLALDHEPSRALNVLRLVSNGAAPLAAAVGGLLAATCTLGTPLIAGGVITLAFAGLAALPGFLFDSGRPGDVMESRRSVA